MLKPIPSSSSRKSLSPAAAASPPALSLSFNKAPIEKSQPLSAQASLAALREWSRDYKLCLEALADTCAGVIIGNQERGAACEPLVREQAARRLRQKGLLRSTMR